MKNRWESKMVDGRKRTKGLKQMKEGERASNSNF